MIDVYLYHYETGLLDHGDECLLDAWHSMQKSYVWVNLRNNTEESEARLLQQHFNLHPLAIQDAQRDRHPPKLEAFDNHTFMILKGLAASTETLDFATIQIALFISDRYVITRSSGFSPSIEQCGIELEQNAVKLFSTPANLAIRLSRIMVGRYLKMLLNIEPRLEILETAITQQPRDEILTELIGLKSDLKKFRRVFTYHEHIYADLKNREYPGIPPTTIHEINDIYEQQERACSLASLYYELASDLIDGYISVASHHLNQIMKVLTVVMSIFIPLSFLAGIYGMNFENMPELHSTSGYFILLAVMFFIVALLLFIFRRKRWL